jgi:hypothetical protein
MAMVVSRKGHNRLWLSGKNARGLAKGTAKVSRREAAREIAYAKIVQKYS